MQELLNRVKKIELNVEDVNLAIELIKTYGFNPKEYKEMMEVLK